MGEAQRKKHRLGEWYGKPIVPGHPDFRPPEQPKKPEYDSQTAEVRVTRSLDAESKASPFFRRPAAGLALIGLVMAGALATSPRDPNKR